MRRSALLAFSLFCLSQAAPPISASAAPQRPLVGAIRWDGWVGDFSTVGLAVEKTLGPEHWHSRLPYFGQEITTNQVHVRSITQADADLQIAFARAAGLDYWAFVMYDRDEPLSMFGLNLYLSSAHSNDVKFCMIPSVTKMDPSTWPNMRSELLSYFQLPNYQKVQGNRPLLFLLVPSQTNSPGGFATWADAKAAFDELRTATVAAGLGPFYAVVMRADPTAAQNIMTNVGFDAISTYAINNNDSTAPYATLDAYARNWWNRARATGAQVVPPATVGFDRRPRVENPVSWEPWQQPGVGLNKYYSAPTPAEWGAHLQAALDWVNANSNAAPANAVLAYAWNEIDEGAWLLPTHTEETARLAAMRSVLQAPVDSNHNGLDDLWEVWNAATNVLSIFSQPGDLTVTDGFNATFSVGASGTPPLNYFWQRDRSPIPGATGSSYTTSTVQISDSGSEFLCVVSNASGTVVSRTATLTVVPAAPSISSNPQSLTVTQGFSAAFDVTAGGTAPLGFFWLRNGAPIPAATGSNYTLANVQVSDSGSQFSCLVSNAAGTATSQPATLTVVPTTPVRTLTIASLSPDSGVSVGVTSDDGAGNGDGITPFVRTYSDGVTVTLTAPANASGHSFLKWQQDGTDLTTNKTFALAMLADHVVAAVYDQGGSVTGQSWTNGTYNGLFYDANGVTQDSSGRFSISSTASKKFSGYLQIGQSRYRLTGQFDSFWKWSRTILRHNQTSLTVNLQIDLTDADRISGVVSNASWTAELAGDRAVFDGKKSPAFHQGHYTMVIAGDYGSTTRPGGDSSSIVSVDKRGRVVMAGALADGTRMSQTATLSKHGQWPLYVPLYSGQGSLLSWINLTNTGGNDLAGQLSWIKPALPRAKYYPAGFALETMATGSLYVRPANGSRVLNFTDADLVLMGGNLTQSITNPITIGADNKVTSADKTTLTFKLPTGSFSGRVINPATAKWLSFNGVVLTNFDIGIGNFLGTNQSGRVLLLPR